MNFFFFGDAFCNSALLGSMFCPFFCVSSQLNMIKATFLDSVKLEDEAFNFMVETLDPDTKRMNFKVIDEEGLGDLEDNSLQVVCYCGIICALQRGLYKILAQHRGLYVGNPSEGAGVQSNSVQNIVQPNIVSLP